MCVCVCVCVCVCTCIPQKRCNAIKVGLKKSLRWSIVCINTKHGRMYLIPYTFHQHVMNWRAFRRGTYTSLIPMISVFWKQYSHLPYFKYILKLFYLFTPKSLFSVRSWSCQQSFSHQGIFQKYTPQSQCAIEYIFIE